MTLTMTLQEHKDFAKNIQLPHYTSIGKEIFAAATETGRTVATGSADKVLKAVLEADEKLYIYCQH